MDTLFSNKNWFFKYKLHHLVFWAIYHYIWWSLHLENLTQFFSTLLDPSNALKYGSYVMFQAAGVYFCLYYLIPKFLEKGKYVLFLVLLSLTILSMAGFIYVGAYHLSAFVAGQDVVTRFNLGNNPTYFLFKNNALPSSIASMTLGMSIKLAKNYVEAQQRQQELEKEKLETELKFLKSQFNPHFLFNTINSIFVLINKNTQLASESLAKFSSLLRYQLYECNEAQIPLDRELVYLESFIELEKLRQNQNFEIKYSLLPKYSGNLNIAPFILMPFIENAFKHVSQKQDQVNCVNIDLSLDHNELRFVVSNSFSLTEETSKNVVDYSGLGLKNVKRRLDLLYPRDHELRIQKNEGLYLIHLKINLSGEPVSQTQNLTS